MPYKIPIWWEGFITALSKEDYSYSAIIKRCQENNFTITKKGIHGVLKRSKEYLLESPKKEFQAKICHPRSRRKPDTIRKVKNLVKKENPLTQRAIAKYVKTSTMTVNRIIREDLNLTLKKKGKVH